MSEIVIEQADTTMVRPEKNQPASTRNTKRNKRGERGMTTAEYAVGTVAAAGLGGVLLKVITDPAMRDLIWKIIKAILEQFLGVKAF